MRYPSPKGAWIGGVAAEIANRFGLNVIAVRLVALVALAVFPLAIGVLYLAGAWLLRQKQNGWQGWPAGNAKPPPPRDVRPSARPRGAPLQSRMRDLEARLAEIEAEIVTSELNDTRR